MSLCSSRSDHLLWLGRILTKKGDPTGPGCGQSPSGFEFLQKALVVKCSTPEGLGEDQRHLAAGGRSDQPWPRIDREHRFEAQEAS